MRAALFLVALAALTSHVCASPDDVISEDSYFFGQSPPVYPSPRISDHGAWKDAVRRARAFVAQMTLDEKVSLTAGSKPPNGCSGFITAIERLNFPGMCLNDASAGVHAAEFVSSWPSGIHVGASWNKELAFKRAKAMGSEFKKKGVNVMLGPQVGPLGRVVTGGRNWEGFSVDPYLSGALVHETVAGVQENGVIAGVKHFIVNEQETIRAPNETTAGISFNVDDATMHELYLWPFQDAVRAGTGNVMCATQRVNNSYACQNSKTLNGLLKSELGFQGFVVTDWDSLHSGYDAALAGLDLAMPNEGEFWGAKLTEAVKNGTVAEERVDDMAIRIVSTWFQMNQHKEIPEPGVGMPANLSLPHKIVDARDPNISNPILFDGAAEGHVLVKNVRNALPLRKPRLLSILGYSARASPHNMVGSIGGFPAWAAGIQAANISEYAHAFLGILNGTLEARISPIALQGTLLSGGGSGATSPTTFISPFDALVAQADTDNTQIFWDFTSARPEVVGVSDACLVFGNAFASEAFDRVALRDDYTDQLILSVAAKCANTIVILHNAGVRLVDPWINHPNVTAVVLAHLPGEGTGKALAALLYGQINFSGKLPYTIAKNESDYGALLSPSLPEGRFSKFPQSNLSEGAYIDYRYFDRNSNMTEPRFEFGFGLSYTTFNYSNLNVGSVKHNLTRYPSGPIIQGGQSDLWEVIAEVSVDVTNTGHMDGAEAAQLYVGIPGGPQKQLRGFEKPSIRIGETVTVSFKLTRRDLSVWDTIAQKWRLNGAGYKIYVGSSSRKLPLTASLEIGTTVSY